MTFAEIAAELGVDERTVRRVVSTVLRRMANETDASDTGEVLRALTQGLRANYFSTEEAGFLRVPRRFSADLGSGPEHASRAASTSLRRLSSGPVSGVDGRVGHLPPPRRFRSKP